MRDVALRFPAPTLPAFEFRPSTASPFHTHSLNLPSPTRPSRFLYSLTSATPQFHDRGNQQVRPLTSVAVAVADSTVVLYPFPTPTADPRNAPPATANDHRGLIKTIRSEHNKITDRYVFCFQTRAQPARLNGTRAYFDLDCRPAPSPPLPVATNTTQLPNYRHALNTTYRRWVLTFIIVYSLNLRHPHHGKPLRNTQAEAHQKRCSHCSVSTPHPRPHQQLTHYM